MGWSQAMVNLGQQATGPRAAPSAARVVIDVGRSVRAGKAYRVEAPDRVLRMFGLLSAARDELDLTAVPPECQVRVQHLLETVSAELQRSVSPALADELRGLVHAEGIAPGATQLRVEYASLLGWASGLVVAMLDQLAAAADDQGPAARGGRALGSLYTGRQREKQTPVVLLTREVPGHEHQ